MRRDLRQAEAALAGGGHAPRRDRRGRRPRAAEHPGLRRPRRRTSPSASPASTPVIDATALAQERALADLAVAELQAQQQRLGSYATQAQFALASLYDGATQRGWPMSASRHLWLAVAGVLAIGWSGTAESARKKAEPTLGSLAGRSAPVDRSQPVQAAPDDAASSYEAFLQHRRRGPGAARRRRCAALGDLRLEQAAALSAAGDGRRRRGAGQGPRGRRRLPASCCANYPDYAARDAVLYQLARASEVAGDGDAAMAALDELVRASSAGCACRRGTVPPRRGLLQRAALRRRGAGLRVRCSPWARPARSTSRRCTSAAGRSSSSATMRRAAATSSRCSTRVLVAGRPAA